MLDERRFSADAPLLYDSIVGAVSEARPSQRPARKRPKKASAGLSKHQATGVIEAALHAGRIGLPLNRHVTIRLERAGIPDDDAVKAVGSFLTRFRDWLRKQGHQTAFTWVRENGPSIGTHVHILLHLPDGVILGSHRSRRWIVAISGKSYRAGTIKTKRISPSAYMQNLGVLVGYLCKGASREVAESLGLERLKPGGSIVGKRAGWSENVGAKARRDLGARGPGRGAEGRASPKMVPSRLTRGPGEEIKPTPKSTKKSTQKTDTDRTKSGFRTKNPGATRRRGVHCSGA